MAIRSPRRSPPPPLVPEVVFGFEHDTWLAADVARECGVEYRTISVHVFPDGESKVTAPGGVRHAAICGSLGNPNCKLIEVLLAASALRDQGAEIITLVAPYLPYMRQDKAFHAGEAVSQRVIGRLLADAFDRFIAVDPHLHRVKNLRQVFGGKAALSLTAGRAMAGHLGVRNLTPETLAIGPDIESRPLVRAFARTVGIEWGTAAKIRRGDREVELTLPDLEVRDRPVAIVDDIVSSGATIIGLVRMLKERGAKSVEVYVTHALFDEKVKRGLRRAGVDRIFSCDGVRHSTNAVSLAPLIARGLRAWR